MKWKRKTIKEGKHTPDGLQFCPQIGCDTLSYYIRFTESCMYYMTGPDELDLSKLPGIAQWYHHWNSIRPGWRWNRHLGAIEIFAYAYRGAKNMYVESLKENDNNRYKIGDIAIDDPQLITVMVRRGEYVLEALGNEIRIDRNAWPNVGYLTGFYMMGDSPALQDTHFEFERVR